MKPKTCGSKSRIWRRWGIKKKRRTRIGRERRGSLLPLGSLDKINLKHPRGKLVLVGFQPWNNMPFVYLTRPEMVFCLFIQDKPQGHGPRVGEPPVATGIEVKSSGNKWFHELQPSSRTIEVLSFATSHFLYWIPYLCWCNVQYAFVNSVWNPLTFNCWNSLNDILGSIQMSANKCVVLLSGKKVSACQEFKFCQRTWVCSTWSCSTHDPRST